METNSVTKAELREEMIAQEGRLQKMMVKQTEDLAKIVNTAFQGVEERLRSIEDRLDRIEDRLDILGGRVDILTKEVKAIRVELERKPDREELDALEKRVAILEQKQNTATA